MTAYYIERNMQPWLAAYSPLARQGLLSRASNFDIELLAEGGANIVFTLYPGDDPLPSKLTNKLLRLRKDLPHGSTAEEQLRALEAGMTIAIAEVDDVPLGVDTAEDLEKARAALAQRGRP